MCHLRILGAAQLPFSQLPFPDWTVTTGAKDPELVSLRVAQPLQNHLALRGASHLFFLFRWGNLDLVFAETYAFSLGGPVSWMFLTEKGNGY